MTIEENNIAVNEVSVNDIAYTQGLGNILADASIREELLDHFGLLAVTRTTGLVGFKFVVRFVAYKQCPWVLVRAVEHQGAKELQVKSGHALWVGQEFRTMVRNTDLFSEKEEQKLLLDEDILIWIHARLEPYKLHSQ